MLQILIANALDIANSTYFVYFVDISFTFSQFTKNVMWKIIKFTIDYYKPVIEFFINYMNWWSLRFNLSFEIPFQWIFFILQFELFSKFNLTVSFFELCFLSRYQILIKSSTSSPSIMTCIYLKISRFIFILFFCRRKD